MDTIELKRKIGGESLFIFDDFLAGGASGEWYAIEQFGRIYCLSTLVDHYKFPLINGHHEHKILWALKGGKPETLKRVEFYEQEVES